MKFQIGDIVKVKRAKELDKKLFNLDILFIVHDISKQTIPGKNKRINCIYIRPVLKSAIGELIVFEDELTLIQKAII